MFGIIQVSFIPSPFGVKASAGLKEVLGAGNTSLSASALSPIPSPSESVSSEASNGKASSLSKIPSLSSSGSQTSPNPSLSVSN